ncbi:thiamine pyrophosphate-dependent dehydrogenase E1 component subunit alpha [Thermodesulfitimonas autotrophica]|uniref:thiamine pyrophosphate-dependent dehydrogenase E1 component subunit alpha n=1 Tax=Thermodesulfitimonas autotrophica TaxID=1894989 RepID=UPI002FE3D999
MDMEELYRLYSLMVEIRLVEEAIVREYPMQQIRTPVHLYIGQEAVAAGVALNLRDGDYVVSNHRSHGHCLAKGMDLEPFFRELYGRQGGVCGGWGGSMHLCDMSRGIVGSSAIVGGGIPIGAGVALKQKLCGEESVTVVFFGDGAVDEGIFWETLNFAALKELPVLFVMEDNRYASQTPKEERQAYRDIVPIIAAFGIPAVKVDGNDPVAVATISGGLVAGIREGRGPAFLYCQTYRWLGHVGPIDDIDAGYRSPDEVSYWRKRCPLARLEAYLRAVDPADAPARMREIRTGWEAAIDRAIKAAKEAPYALD